MASRRGAACAARVSPTALRGARGNRGARQSTSLVRAQIRRLADPRENSSASGSDSPLCGCREPHKFDAPLDHRPRHSHGFLRSQRHVLGLHRGFRRWHGHGPSRGARRVRARQVHGQASPGGACHNRVRHRHPSPRGVPSLGPSGAPSRRSTSTADATRPNPRVFQPRSARTRASLPTPSRPLRRPLTRSPRSSPFIHSRFHPRAEGDRRGSRRPGGQGQEGQEVDAPIRPARSCNVT